MGKYYGAIGYGLTTETVPGVWTNGITERKVYGETMKNSKRSESSDNLNDDIMVSIKISFISDPFALMNFHLIKYATYMGTPWKVTMVEEEFPRLVLTLGGMYNGDTQ